jgi:Arc/MetJ-type ribon-helix-helix transcriptional regulator
MTIQLPEVLERYLQDEVQGGEFASPDEAIVEALRLLRQSREEARFHRKALTADELNQQLLDAGLLGHIPAHIDPNSYEEFTPIVVEGEPVSETIIRERRWVSRTPFNWPPP